MTQDEFKKFFRYITAVTNDTNPSPERTQVYWDALNDLSFDIAMLAAKKVIATLENPFLPMPAVFRGAAAEITSPRAITAGEAYEKVLRAIRGYGSYRETEAIASLDQLTQKAVQAIGWKSLCLSEEPDTIRAQFRMAYEAIAKRETTEARVPEQLKQLTSQIAEEKKMIPELKRDNTMRDEKYENFYL